MNRYYSLFLIGLYLAGSNLLAETRPFPIESVVLYNDRALVRRASSVPLSAGQNRIIYRGPAVKLKSETLVGFCAESNCIVQSIWTRTEKASQAIDERLASLEKRRKELQTELDAINRQKDKLEALANLNDRFLKLLLQGVSDAAFEKSSAQLAAWQSARAHVSRSSDDIQLDIQRILRKRDTLKEELELVESRIKQLDSDLSDEIRIVELTLYVPKATTVKTGFDYMVEDAGWDVSYNLEYRKGSTTIPGKVVGLIQQSSGEDWVNVELELSTSRPDRGGNRPALSAIRVHAREVAANTEIVTQNQAVDFDGAEGEASESEIRDQQERQVRFRIPDRVSIPSGKRYQRITVAALELKVLDEHLRVVGQVSSSPHRALQLKNESRYSMLSGKGYIYGPDGYMGMTYIEYTPPGSELMAGLGVTGDVRLNRKIYRSQKEAGLISSNRIFQTEVRLELENPTGKSQSIKLYERIPVTATEKVKVRILEDTSGGYKELTGSSGILVWALTLKPGEKRTLRLGYQVEVPEGISGNFYGN